MQMTHSYVRLRSCAAIRVRIGSVSSSAALLAACFTAAFGAG